MSEAGFRLFNGLFPFGAELLYAICLALFLRPFLARGRGRNATAVFSACLALCLLCRLAPTPRGTFGVLLTALLTAGSGLLGLERAMAFLLAILYWDARVSSGLMAESLYFIAESLLPVRNEPLEAIFLRPVLLLSSFLLAHAALMAAMLYALRRRLAKRPFPLHRRELCYLCLVPAAGILFGQMVSELLVEYKDGMLLRLYARHPAFLAAVPLLALLFFAGAYLTIAFQQGMAAMQEERAAHYAEYQQMQAIRARMAESEQLYARLRQLRHDMRGHLANIKGLAQSGEYGGLEEYIERLDGTIGSFALALRTGNPVTDVILNDARQRCLDAGIPFHADFHYPGQGGYDAFDMGIILQNLLQNAIEASEKVSADRRSISLSGKRKGRFFLLEVRNAFAGEVAFGIDGLPATTKPEGAPLHGIGLPSVRREAEKYMGGLELKTDGQEFSAAVLLQERSRL